jgi:hypothetical protein
MLSILKRNKFNLFLLGAPLLGVWLWVANNPTPDNVLACGVVTLAVFWSILPVLLDTTIPVFARMPPENVRMNFTHDSHRNQVEYWEKLHMLSKHFNTDPKATEKYVRKVLAGKY